MYQKIVVPLDGSELAECALSHLKQLLQEGPVREIVLLNAVEIQLPWKELSGGEEGPPVPFDYKAFMKTVTDKSEKYLAKMQSRLSSQGINVKTETIESNGPAHAITDYAQKHGADLIVMATHGYTGMKRMLLGSTALKVLHESNVPVLLIRPDACRI